jgi:hypothetical protein
VIFDVDTPLHPNARHRHSVSAVHQGYKDPRGRPYDIYYCHCGMTLAFVPKGPFIG